MRLSKTVLVVGDDPTELLFSGDRLVAVDVETTGLEFYDMMLGTALAWRDQDSMRSCYLYFPQGQISMDEMSLPIGEQDYIYVIKTLFEQHVLVFHNECFDYRAIFRETGLPPPTRSHDTKHLAGLVGFNLSKSLYNLYQAHVRKGLPDWYKTVKEDRKSLAKYTLGQSSQYGRQDAVMTLELLSELRNQMQAVLTNRLQPLDPVYNHDRAFSRLVMNLIYRGLPLNFAWCERKTIEITSRVHAIERQLAAEGLRFIGSNDSVATFLFKVLELEDYDQPLQYGGHLPITRVRTRAWPQGVPSVDEKSLKRYSVIPQVAAILEHRALVHALGTWLKPYYRAASITGKVHSLLDPFGTVSHRMAASHPNVQGIPMEDRGDLYGSMMGMFGGDAERQLISFDLKQAEVRMAALCSRDPNLAAALADGQDPYTLMAERTWNDPTRRQDAKRAVLSTIYEIGVASFVTKYEVPELEADKILKDFRRAFPQIKIASSIDAHFVDNARYIPAYNGKPRWFGPEEIDPSYKAFNQRVQMNVAQLMEDVMLKVEQAYPGWLLLQVHDNLLMSIPKEPGLVGNIKDNITKMVSECLPQGLTARIRPPVPFLVDSKLWEPERK